MTGKDDTKTWKITIVTYAAKIEEELDSSQSTLRDGPSATTHTSEPPTATKPT